MSWLKGLRVLDGFKGLGVWGVKVFTEGPKSTWIPRGLYELWSKVLNGVI